MIAFNPGASDLVGIQTAFNTPQVIPTNTEKHCPNSLRKGHSVFDILVKKEVRTYYNL